MISERKSNWYLYEFDDFNKEIQCIYELLSIYYDNHIVLEDYDSREYCFNDNFFIVDKWDCIFIKTEFVDIRYDKLDCEYCYIKPYILELIESEILYVIKYLKNQV